MNETEKKVLRHIRNLRPIILQDGRLDIVETAWLVKAIHQDEDSLGDYFKAFVARLREVRADGVVTPQESESPVRLCPALGWLNRNEGRAVGCVSCADKFIIVNICIDLPLTRRL